MDKTNTSNRSNDVEKTSGPSEKHKYCIVPGCKNTTESAPDRDFFLVPKDRQISLQWQKAMNRIQYFLGKHIDRYCCGDHFDLKNDVENITYIETMKMYNKDAGRMKLKKGVIPHIFECQKRKLNTDESSSEKSVLEQKNVQNDCPVELMVQNTPIPIQTIFVKAEVDTETDLPIEFLVEGDICHKSLQVDIKPMMVDQSTQCNFFVKQEDNDNDSADELVAANLKTEKSMNNNCSCSEFMDSGLLVGTCVPRDLKESEEFDFQTATDTPQGDEWYHFGNNVACQLRNMPLENALVSQKKIMDILIEERITSLKSEKEEPKEHEPKSSG